MQKYKEIQLSDIQPSPFNPRTIFKGSDFDELVESIRQKGVISPILLRPIEGGDKAYEIVFGERRFRALGKIAGENGGPEACRIPSLVRELTEDEAFDLTMIENLQREDLNALEEAEGFKAYVDRHGEDSLVELAERTSISPQYMRRRIRVLSLPKKVLKAWGKDEIRYGHLEQFMRLKTKKQIGVHFDKMMEESRWGGIPTVGELKRTIDNFSPMLKTALFDTKACRACSQNSDVQKQLFGDLADDKKRLCLDPVCFKKNQNNWLLSNWDKSEYRKKYKTNGFCFTENCGHDQYNSFKYAARRGRRCLKCDDFVTLIDLAGDVGHGHGQVCIGDKNCFAKTSAPKKNKTSASSDTAGDAAAPRVSWHGEFFREQFYQQTLPERFKAEQSESKKACLAFLSMFLSNHELQTWTAEQMYPKSSQYWVEEEALITWLQDMSLVDLTTLIHEAALEIIMQTHNGVGERIHRIAAKHIGIDVNTEWIITEEYLQKKTKAEMMEMGEQLSIFGDPKAQVFLHETLLKKRGKFTSCKKGELIQVFLESGVDLAGKVPDEIKVKDSNG